MPHYLGGKLGRSSSRSIFPSVHLTPQALPRAAVVAAAPAPAIPLARQLLVSTSRVKKGTIRYPLSAPSPFLSFSRSRILLFPFGPLYIVYFRIGSLSTRDPPPSPLSYGPIVVFSPSLLPSPPAEPPLCLKAPQHHPNSPFPQNRESV